MIPDARDLFVDELRAVMERVDRTKADGRDAFHDGSDSYDRAVVAVVGLAALFESRRFDALLVAADDRERRGIIATRNIAAHHGYASMDEDEFWQTISVDIPGFVAKLRQTNGL